MTKHYVRITFTHYHTHARAHKHKHKHEHSSADRPSAETVSACASPRLAAGRR